MRPSSHDAPFAVASGGSEHAGSVASIAVGNKWIEILARFGHIVRGLVYLVPGVLALRLALGAHGAAVTQAGAIEVIGNQPSGRALLVAVAVGLAGYALWGVIRVVFDPLQKGHSAAGLAKRFGFATSALAYASLLVATIRYLMSALTHMAKPHDWTAELLERPFGQWLLAAVGLFWLGAGIGEIARGWRREFEEDLALGRVRPVERRWAVGLGRFGIVSRGIVFAIIGLLLVGAALRADAHHGGGLDDALLALAGQPFGQLLLAAAGLGLIAFGLFSAMCARWMRMRASGYAPS